MKSSILVIAGLAFSTVAFGQDPLCYTLVNATTHAVVVNYQYPGGVIPENGTISDSFSAGSKKTYCFQTYSATANIATPNTLWEGNHPMIMGNVFGSLPTGTYRMVGGPASPPPDPGTPDSPIIWFINGLRYSFM